MSRTERLARWDAAPRPLVVPSLLNSDFSCTASELDAVARAGAVAVHLDVMDGHFVPNLTFGAPVISRWREVSPLAFDTHLMITDPARYFDDFVEAGADRIFFHIEAVPDPTELITAIRARGCRAGLSLNPPTPLAGLLPFLSAIDAVLVMSVMPGFGGQVFDESALAKVEALRRARPDLEIAIDGGINPTTAARAVAAGVTQLVAGSYVFHHGGPDPYAVALVELTEGSGRVPPGGGDPGPSAGAPSPT